MPPDAVDLVRAAYDAYFRGDTDAMLALVAADVVVEQPPEQPDFQAYAGRAGVLQAMADWTGAWADYRLEVLEIVDAGAHVVVHVRQHGRGKGSGVEVEGDYWFVHAVEGGQVTSWRMFTSEREAHQAAGPAG